MLQHQLDHFRREVVDAVYGQKEWLDAITVGVPEDCDATVWKREVQAVLVDLHLDGVDVTLDRTSHQAPWIRALELGPGWT